MKDGILLILDRIICLTTVTRHGRPVIRSGYFIAKRVNTKSESSHTTNDVMGQIKEHVFGKGVERPHLQGPGCRWSLQLRSLEHLPLTRRLRPAAAPRKAPQSGHQCSLYLIRGTQLG